jgi:hypothetical protein
MTDTLKSTYEQCAHLTSPPLRFVPDSLDRHREIILRDLSELADAASREMEKSVLMLAGSIFEAVLHAFLQGPQQQAFISARRKAEFVFDVRSNLRECIKIYNKWFTQALPGSKLEYFVADYRDFVQVNRELRAAPVTCGRAAREMLRALDSFLGCLESLQ